MTIAQQLNVTTFPFIIKDKDGNELYGENSDAYWGKTEYDAHGREIYYENSDGWWYKNEYDAHGNQMSYEDSTGFWRKREYNAQDEEIYYENSDGIIIDNRPKIVEVTLQQIADKLGINVAQLKIKD